MNLYKIEVKNKVTKKKLAYYGLGGAQHEITQYLSTLLNEKHTIGKVVVLASDLSSNGAIEIFH